MNRIFLLFILCVNILSAQDKPLTPEEAQTYFNDSDNLMMQIVYEGEELFEMYAKREPGEILILEKEIFKVVGVEDAEVQNCAILSVRTDSISLEQHKALQKEVLAAYKGGTSFKSLIKKYGRNEHSGAENIDVMLRGNNFEDALTTRKTGDVFTTDFDEPRGFYLVVINSPPRIIRAVKVLVATYK